MIGKELWIFEGSYWTTAICVKAYSAFMKYYSLNVSLVSYDGAVGHSFAKKHPI